MSVRVRTIYTLLERDQAKYIKPSGAATATDGNLSKSPLSPLQVWIKYIAFD